MEPILAAVGIHKRFGALVVLDGVDFAVGRGEAVGIVGPNGAGKTTLLNVLAGSLRPDAGHIELDGADVSRAAAARRCRLGIGRAHQVPRPFGDMTVFENVFVGAAAGGGGPRSEVYARAIEALDACDLGGLANRRAETLGLLHRKRLELARALATSPSVLLLDEVGGGLTDAEADELLATITAFRGRGISVVWIEHIVHVLVRGVQRLVCMAEGRVIADGEPSAVMSNAQVIDAYLGRAVA
ncbi:MAG TPA: ATP-binding cassette domain-containing protein [Gaiellaceae bacterium]|nr:ATP-binding cassette domain-containing protein [Gaiellaceae bacterium]